MKESMPEYQKFLPAVKNFSASRYASGAVDRELEMANSGRISIEYAPFDHIQRNAQLVIVGLTPGRTQAANALAEMKKCLLSGRTVEDALKNAKQFASFSGPMRSSLVKMLDHIGLPRVYGHSSAADFFADEARVHFTSALRYPVYINGKNYSGSPSPLKTPLLRNMIETYLAEEAAVLRNAAWIPLGIHAQSALSHLCEKGCLSADRVLIGLPHPSGANAERISYFLGNKPRSELSKKTDPERLDDRRRRLLRQVDRLSSMNHV